MDIDRHICWLYSTDEEHRAFVTGFLRQALDSREKVVYLAHSREAGTVLEFLRAAGLDTQPYLASGQLEILSAGAAFLHNDSFDVKRLAASLDIWTQQTTKSGFAGLRVTGEMTWALQEGLPAGSLQDYEAKINEYESRCPLTWVCQYDRRRFDPARLIDLLAWHDSTILGAGLASGPGQPMPIEREAVWHYGGDREKPKTDGSQKGGRPAGEELLQQVGGIEGQLQELLAGQADSQRRYTAVEGLIPLGIWMADAQGGMTYVARSVLEMTGLTLEEYHGLGWARLLPPEDVERTLAGWRRCVATGDLWECEERLLGKDGDYRTILVEGAPVRNAEGVITGWIGINLDVTSAKRAEEALRESEERFRAIFDDSAVAIAVVDMEGRFLETNSAAQEMFGYSAEEFRRRTFGDITHPEDLTVEMEMHREMQAGERELSQLEKRFYRKDGSLIWARMTASLVKDAQGRPEFVIGMVEDITERKAEEAARAFLTEARTTLFSSLDTGTVLKRLADVIVPRFADLCAINMLREDGTIEQTAVRHVNPIVTAMLNATPEVHPLQIDEPHPVSTALRTGEPLFYPDVTDDMYPAFVKDEVQLAGFRKLGVRSIIIVPLEARDRRIGAITLAISVSGRRYNDKDLMVAEELGRRAATAIENARLYGEAQAALQASEESRTLLNTLLATSPAGFAFLDRDFRYVSVNEALAALNGLPVEAHIGRTVREVIQARADTMEPLLRQVLDTGRPVLNFERGTRIMNLYPVRGNGDNVVGVGAVLIDITERKQAEEALRESEALLRSFIDNVPQGTHAYMKDLEGRMILDNSRLREHVSLGGDALLGKTDFDFHPKEIAEALWANDLKVIETGQPIEVEEAVYEEDGLHPYLTIKFPIRDSNGNIRAVGGISTDIAERKRAEEALRESERKYRELADSLPQSVYEADTNGRLTFVNQNAFTAFGYSREDFEAGGNILQSIVPEDRQRALESIRRVMAGESVGGQEYQALRKDGTTFPVMVYSNRVIRNGRIAGLRGLVVDISESKQAAEALQAADERFRAIFEGADIGISLIDMEGNFLAANRTLQEITGYSAEELAHMKFADITHPDDLAAEMAYHRQMEAGTLDCSQLEKRYFRKDGSLIWIRLTASLVRNAYGQPERVIGMIEDITEHKRAEQNRRFLAEASHALAGSLDLETTLQTVVDLAVPRLADCAAIDIDEQGRIRLAAIASADVAQKRILQEMAGRYAPSREMPGPIWDALATGKPSVLNNIPDSLWPTITSTATDLALIKSLEAKAAMAVPLLARGKMFGALYLATTGSGRRFCREDVRVAEELARRAAPAIDNAMLYAAERQARAEAEAATKARDEFLSMASHELRTPLTSLRGFAHMAARRFEKDGLVSPEKVRHYFDIIDEQSIRMTTLVNQLLDVSRIEAGKIELDRRQADIVSLARGVVARAQMNTSHHTIRISAPQHLPALVDPVRIEQVLTNLIDNAVKYSPRGGPVDVFVWSPDDTTVKISVRDYGVGIPVEHRDGLFSRFYQAHKRGQFGGMGLGLYISREIVHMHGGQIEADFPVEGGSCFVVTLPREMDGLSDVPVVEDGSCPPYL